MTERETVFTLDATPVKFGPGAAADAGWELKRLGVERALLVTDIGVAAAGHPRGGAGHPPPQAQDRDFGPLHAPRRALPAPRGRGCRRRRGPRRDDARRDHGRGRVRLGRRPHSARLRLSDRRPEARLPAAGLSRRPPVRAARPLGDRDRRRRLPLHLRGGAAAPPSRCRAACRSAARRPRPGFAARCAARADARRRRALRPSLPWATARTTYGRSSRAQSRSSACWRWRPEPPGPKTSRRSCARRSERRPQAVAPVSAARSASPHKSSSGPSSGRTRASGSRSSSRSQSASSRDSMKRATASR